MASNKVENSTIRGMNIYLDKEDHYVYYDRFTKNGYLIKEKNVKQYYFYQNRYLYVIIACILATTFVNDLVVAAGLGIMAIVLLEYFFRVRFLKNLTIIGDFKPDKKASTLKKDIKPEEKSKLFIKAILYIALAVLIILNAYIEQFELLLLVGSWLIGVFAIGMAIYYLYIGIRK